MQTIKKEIDKEQYDRLKAMSHAEQHAELFPNGVPDQWAYGYGYYGHTIYEKDGKYYIQHKIGDSCD